MFVPGCEKSSARLAGWCYKTVTFLHTTLYVVNLTSSWIEASVAAAAASKHRQIDTRLLGSDMKLVAAMFHFNKHMLQGDVYIKGPISRYPQVYEEKLCV